MNSVLFVILILSPFIGGILTYLTSRFSGSSLKLVKFFALIFSFLPVATSLYLLSLKFEKIYFGNPDGVYLLIDKYSLFFIFMFFCSFLFFINL